MKANLVKNCKLCRLIKIDKPTWHEVHQKILDEGLSYSIVCKWLNGRMNTLGEDITFNDMNFSTHFRKHITSEEERKRAMKQATLSEPEKGTTSFDEVEQEEADAMLPELTDQDRKDLANYEFLQKYIKMAQDNIEMYGGLIKKKEYKQPQSLYNDVEGFHRLLTELAKVQESLSKARASEKVAGRAVIMAVKLLSVAITSDIVDVVAEAEGLLQQEMPNSRLPSEIRKMIVERIKSKSKDSAEDITRRIYAEFNIK